MKISKLFHYLYAIVLLLPVMVAPVFLIYSHRHTIDSYSVTRQELVNQPYNLYQGVKNGKPTQDLVDISFEGDNIHSYENGYIHIYANDDATSIIFHTYSYLENSNDIYAVKITSYNNDDNYNVPISMSSPIGDPLFVGEISSPKYIDNAYTQVIYLVMDDILDVPVNTLYIRFDNSLLLDVHFYFKDIQVFNLTNIFGSGNEPTKEVFESYLTQDYYDYGNNYVNNYVVQTVTYDDTDIGSQFIYCSYNTINDYFNFNNISFFNGIYDWIQLNFFNGTAPLGFFLVWSYLVYWLFVSIFWLLFDLFMYVPQLAHRWIDKARIE